LIKQGYRGYCVHQPFNGLRVPVPLQNIVLRDFLNRKGLMFKLSVNELDFPNSHVQLFSLLDQLDVLEGLVMTSIFMLPSDAIIRQKIYRRIQDTHSIIYFVIENMALKDVDDAQKIEDLFSMTRLLPHCLKKI
tara:strand:- start:316 stop:717 length:402 start_codon:yes stop_codon:yes gene_type:complete